MLLRILVIGARGSSLVAFRGHLLATLVSMGHQVTAAAPQDNETVPTYLKQAGVAYVPFAFNRTTLGLKGNVQLIRTFRELILQVQPDLLLAYTAKPVIFGLAAAQTAGIRDRAALITGLGFAFSGTSRKHRLLQLALGAMYRVALRGAKVVIFQNPDDRELFVKKRIVPLHRSAVVSGSGVDTDHYAYAELPPGPPRFIFMARLLISKGLKEYVEAARITKQQFPDAEFCVLGQPDDGVDAIPLDSIRQWEQEGIINYLGSAHDVRPYLRDSHVFVLPSAYREGTPRSILEALSIGRPIV